MFDSSDAIYAGKSLGALTHSIQYDLDGDGVITSHDCPFSLGSPQAKLWWSKVMEPHVKTQITEEMKAKYGDTVIGAYKGKALVPGIVGKDQGDMSYLIDKIRITQGISQESAFKIALKARQIKYGI